MLLKNARIYGPDFRFCRGDVLIEGERIAEVAPHIEGEGIDLCGKTLIPGLCDVHTHGCVGEDWSSGQIEGYRKMARYYAQNGITSVCATTMTLPAGTLHQAMQAIRELRAQKPEGACIQGVNMEGPFFSKEKKGAQNEAYLSLPDKGMFRELQQASGGCILLCDVAPELEGAMAFIEEVCQETVVSIAHTAADYETAKQAIQKGARHATHLYNAMTPFTHRAPGVVGAVFDSDIMAEVISDGKHLAPAVVRITFSILGADRVVLISDSLEACGMPTGRYELGGQTVLVEDGLAKLENGTIAGSATNLFEGMRRAIRFGVPEEEAVRAATYNPILAIGREKEFGSIVSGKFADLVVADSEYQIEKVFVHGKEMVR